MCKNNESLNIMTDVLWDNNYIWVYVLIILNQSPSKSHFSYFYDVSYLCCNWISCFSTCGSFTQMTISCVLFIRFYFIHSHSISNSTSQIVPSTKALQALVSHTESFYVFYIFVFISKFKTNWGAAFICSFPEW